MKNVFIFFPGIAIGDNADLDSAYLFDACKESIDAFNMIRVWH